jgi:DNA-binding LacI/PurR family transcriptional regulator
VAIDNVAAARVATEHLIDLGRRRIAAVNCSPDGPVASRLRYEGYTSAFKAAGLELDPSLVVGDLHDGRDRQSGAAAMEQLLTRMPPPDAVFCFNDLTALGAIRSLLSRGLRVPQEVAVVGVDDIEDGQFSTPTLTTISPNKARLADAAVELLVSRINGSTVRPREVVADFSLVVRESTRPAASSWQRHDVS